MDCCSVPGAERGDRATIAKICKATPGETQWPRWLLAAWRPLELDHIALRVANVEGRAFALRTVYRRQRARFNAVGLKMAANGSFIEGFDAKAEIIEIAALLSGRRPASALELSGNGNKVKQRAAGAQLNQANRILPPLDGATEHVTIKAKHLVEVDNTQHKMVDFTNVDHGIDDFAGAQR